MVGARAALADQRGLAPGAQDAKRAFVGKAFHRYVVRAGGEKYEPALCRDRGGQPGEGAAIQCHLWVVSQRAGLRLRGGDGVRFEVEKPRPAFCQMHAVKHAGDPFFIKDDFKPPLPPHAGTAGAEQLAERGVFQTCLHLG